MPILIRNNQRKHRIGQAALRRELGRVLGLLGRGGDELSVLIAGNASMRRLNKQYRAIDKTTDVLSFPQDEIARDHGGLLGDIVLCAEVARRQAREHGLTLHQELILLSIHGILHLLGMDHERSRREEQRMRRKTRRLFSAIFPGKTPGVTCNY